MAGLKAVGRNMAPRIESLEPRLLLDGADPNATITVPEDMVDRVDSALVTLQDSLGDSVLGRLPIAGEALSAGGRFIDGFRQDLCDALTSAFGDDYSGIVGAVQDVLFTALGPDGANILLDSEDAGDELTAADILISDDDGLSITLHLGSTLVSLDGAFDFDIGLDGLGLEIDAGIDFTLGWDLVLGLGVTADDEFYIDASDDNEMELNVAAMLSEGSYIEGTLGFLQLSATDFAEADDVVGANVTGNTGVFGQAAVDLRDPDGDGRLTWTEIDDAETDWQETVVGSVTAGADVNLHATIDFGDASFPSISTDFDLDWDFLNADTTEEGNQFGGTPEIAFNHVTLDLGSFISDFAGPIIEKIQKVTEPVQPVLDVLTYDIPVISDLMGPTSLLDLAASLGVVNRGFVDAVETVIGLVGLFNGIDTSSSIVINFGDFPLTGVDLREEGSKLADANTGEKDLDVLAEMSRGNAPQNTMNFVAGLNGGGFSFPILNDPMTMFAVLVGKPDVTLFSYAMPTLELSFHFGMTFPIFPGLSAGLDGDVSGAVNLGFGFDTRGIEMFAVSGDVEDVFNGFYIDDHVVGGVDQPELAVFASIQGKAALGIPYILEAGVRGGIYGNVLFDLGDPNPDGKIRANEFLDLLQLGPEYLFNMSGSLSAGLYAYIWAGIDLGWFGKITFFDEDFTIFDETLLDFNFNPLDPPPQPAQLVGDTLVINIGPNRDWRLAGADPDEVARVKRVVTDDVEKIVVMAYGYTKEFDPALVGSIYADGGAGDDEVLIDEGIAVPVVLRGGAGNDSFQVYGSGAVTLYGDEGDDALLVGPQASAAVLYGGLGNDSLQVEGSGVLYGEAGDDLLIGGPGNDDLFGGDGVDTLNGRGGDDTLSGGAGGDLYIWNVGDGSDLFVEGPAATADVDQLTLGGGRVLLGGATRRPRYRQTDDFIALAGYGSAIGVWTGASADPSTQIPDIAPAFIERISVAPSGGADTIVVGDLAGTDVTYLGIDVGYDDGVEANTVIYAGGTGDDSFLVDGTQVNVGHEVLVDEDGYLAGLGDDVHQPVVRVMSAYDGGIARTTYILGSNPDRDRLTVMGLDGQDELTLASGENLVRVQDLIAVTLDGGSGNDTLGSVYSNVELIGGADHDVLIVSDDPNSVGTPEITLDDAAVVVTRGGVIDHLLPYSGFEELQLILGADGDDNIVRVLGTIAGPTTILADTDDDEVSVVDADGPLTVDTGGTGDSDRLVIDRAADTNGLVGLLQNDTITGLHFASPIAYANVETLIFDLGQGADVLSINGTDALDTQVNANVGDDTVIAYEAANRTHFAGGPGKDTLIAVIEDDPNALGASPFAELTFEVETVRVDHVGSADTDWWIGGEELRVGDAAGLLLLDLKGTDRTILNGGTGSDTLTVVGPADPQTVTIEDATVLIEGQQTIVTPRGYIEEVAGIPSIVMSPDNRDLTTLTGAGTLVDYYQVDYDGALYLNPGAVQAMEQTRVGASDPAQMAMFGEAVAISGNYAIIGAAHYNGARGAAYIFEQTSPGVWQQVARMGSTLANSWFGCSVAISGNTAVVGAHQAFNYGAAFVYERTSAGVWTLTTTLFSTTPAIYEHFGQSVDVSGDTIIVGAPDDRVGSNRGAAYVYERVQWGVWAVRGVLVDPGSAGEKFGQSVAIDGDTVIVGVPGDDDRGSNAGSAQVFVRYSIPGVVYTWIRTEVLTGADTKADDNFGYSVAIDGDTAVVGAFRFLFGSQGGAYEGFGAYVFERNAGGFWSQKAKLSLSNSVGSYGHFGESVAIAGDRVVVGKRSPASTGEAYFFQRPADGWHDMTETTRLVTNGGSSAGLGLAVAISGDTILAGAPYESAYGTYFGAAYFYDADMLDGAASLTLSPDGQTLAVIRQVSETTPENLAVSGTASQSTMGWDGFAWRAIDGNTSGVYQDGSVSCTNHTAYSWWQVELAQRSELDRIVLFNRAEYPQLLSNFRLSVFDGSVETWGQNLFVGSGYVPVGGYTVALPEGTTGDRVRIQFLGYNNENTGYLALAEVQVFGTPAIDEGISVFNRDVIWGELTYIQELVDTTQFAGVDVLAFSPDSSILYAATDDGIAIFSRDALSGRLTFVRTVDTGVLGNTTAIAAVDDFVYVAGEGDKLWTFRRVGTDLERLGAGDSAFDIDAVDVSGLILSDDGRTLYAASRPGASIAVFSRDTSTGALALIQAVRNGRDGVRGLRGVASIATADAYLLALGADDDSLVVFRCNPDGTLEFAQRLRNRSGGVQGLENPEVLAVSRTGRWVYVGSSGQYPAPGGVAWFELDRNAPPPAPPIRVEYSGVESLTVISGNREDTVRLRDVGVPVNIQTQDGGDTVIVQKIGNDQPTVIDLGAGEDVLELRRIGANSETTVNGNDGDDAFRISGGAMGSDVTLNGDAHDLGDRLLYDPQGGAVTWNETSAVSGDIAVDTSAGTVLYDTVEDVSILAPPVPAVVMPASIAEGEGLTLQVSAVIPFGGPALFEWDLNGDGEFGEIPSQSAQNQAGQPETVLTFVVDWADLSALGLNDDGQYLIAVRVTDTQPVPESGQASAVLTIVNTSPTLTFSGDASVREGALYSLFLDSVDPGDDAVTGWVIDWGDGEVEDIRSNPSVVTHRYDTPGAYLIGAGAADEDGSYSAKTASGIELFEVAVLDAEPTLQLEGADATLEGLSYELTLLAGDPTGDVIDHWIIEWGDGSANDTVDTPSATLTHVFDDDSARTLGGVFVIRATAIGPDGIYRAQKSVRVDNVAPDLDITGDAFVDEGADYTLNLTSTDPGADALSVWTIQWGDGTEDVVAGDAASASHTYAEGPVQHEIRATAVDEDGTWGPIVLMVDVHDVAPTISIDGKTQVEEGAPYALVLDPPTDPGDDAVTRYIIYWGDGTSDVVEMSSATAQESRSVQCLTHVYANGPATRSVTVDLEDEDGAYAGVAELQVQVINVAPTVDAGDDLTVMEGDLVELAGTFTDPGLDDHEFLWQVTSDNGQVVPDAHAQNFSFTPMDNGSYAVTFTVTDSDDAWASDTVQVTVLNVAPTAQVDELPLLLPGETVNLTGSFTDPGVADTHTAEIDWGDGTASMATLVQGAGFGSFAASHAYIAGGVHEITVTLTDDDAGRDEQSIYATVSGAGLYDGVLMIYGTPGDDYASVSGTGDGMLMVTWSFAGGLTGTRYFPVSEVESILAVMEDGDDRIDITQQVAVPAVLIGGAGNDRLLGGYGDDILMGGPGDDYMDGGMGSDTADYSDASSGIDVRLLSKRADNDGYDTVDRLRDIENVIGSAFDDRIVGDSKENVLSGGDGDDWIDGHTHDDVLHGGPGDDTLIGLHGDDEIHGDAGDDTVHAGAGDDRVYGGEGDDYLQGWAGDDLLNGGAGADVILGRQGKADVLDYSDSPGPVHVDEDAGTAEDGFGTTDVFSDMEIVVLPEPAQGGAAAPVLSDADGNGMVDGADLAIWQQHYHPLGPVSGGPASGDFNGDGKIDGTDLALWQQGYDPLGSRHASRSSETEDREAVALNDAASDDAMPAAAHDVHLVKGPGTGGKLGIALSATPQDYAGIDPVEESASHAEPAASAPSSGGASKASPVDKDDMVDILALAALEAPLQV